MKQLHFSIEKEVEGTSSSLSDQNETVSLVNNNNNEDIDGREKENGRATGML